MKLYNTIFLTLVAILLPCSHYTRGAKTDIEAQPAIDREPIQTGKEPIAEYRIRNNDFAEQPFSVMPDRDNIRQVLKLEFHLEKTPFQNPHTDATDTIYSFRYGKSVINFYKSATRSLLQDAVIADAEIKLSKNVAVGMSKAEFLRTFDVTDKVSHDVILITDEEEFCDHKVIFEKGRTSSIVLRMGVD